MRLGLITDVRLNNSDGSGLSDAQEDIDDDGLTNLEEQTYRTDPLVNDTDHDTILDITELTLGTNASAADSDNDLLTDDSELRLGTNPLVGDSNTNGIPDGNETYTTVAADATLGVEVAITGTGDLA